ncbi:uncharacterized protein LOC118477862 [Aplysia californica]|uniref:Uncharacterized protein LOC118477862 n=1 Tax=Aplysia californica TaxID=6500 RepID=A0ABM1VV38_APLCA|nr:uncharacterized protein LOC118477862 [Aplysia californica]
MEAVKSCGQEAGTLGKLAGMAPSVTRASLHKKAFSMIAETYIMILVDLVAPEVSDVLTFAIIPPSTPRSSLMAPHIVSLTGIKSVWLIPMARADCRGMIELWQPESATMGNVIEESLDLLFIGKPNWAWSL